MTSNIFLNQVNSVSQDQEPSEENPFLKQIEGSPKAEKKEGFFKSSGRTVLQPALGIGKRWTWPADVFKFLSDLQSRAILSEMASEDPLMQGEGREVAEQARQKALEKFPTQDLLEEFIEEKTGLPLRPKNELQKALRLGGEAAGFKRGGMGAKATAGVAAPLVSKGLQEVGVPEGISDFVGLVASGGVPSPSFEKIKKSSGLTTRRFEKLKKPTKVSPERHGIISEKLENDFRGITEDILKENPNYQSVKTDPLYKEKLNEGFAKVEQLAEQMPEKIQKRQILSFLKRRFNTSYREMKGMTSSEAEDIFRKEFGEIIKKTAEGAEEGSVKKYVEQFRKNNSELAEYFEPGKSKSYNSGKRDALLEYNRAIEELFETAYPDSEFTKLFKEQNKKWSELANVDFIEGRLDKIFDGKKINFSELDKILNPSNANIQRPFIKMMGKDGFNKFKQLSKDLTSVKDPYSLLRKAEMGGFSHLARLAGSYLLNPKIGALYHLGSNVKEAMRVLLDKPQLSLEWKSALGSLKAGKYEQAEKQFENLDSKVKELAEKVKPLARKAKVLPEGYAEDVGGKVTQKGLEKFRYSPTFSQIKEFNLKEPANPMTKYDYDIFFNNPMVHRQILGNKIFKNEWNKILKEDSYGKYYSNGADFRGIGTVGDYIKNPHVRKIYEKVLDIPVYLEKNKKGASYSQSAKAISIPDSLSPSTFYSFLIHETHHALQHKFKPHLLEKPFYSWPKEGAEKYYRSIAERKARLAERYIKKDFIKLAKLSGKTRSERQFNLSKKLVVNPKTGYYEPSPFPLSRPRGAEKE